MNRFLYWLNARFRRSDVQCRHFCVTCKYFDQCEDDTNLLNIGKSKENTESCGDSEELKKAS